MKRLLLLGAGHAHAQVLLDWIAAPLANTELVIVSPQSRAPYSGMVPGWGRPLSLRRHLHRLRRARTRSRCGRAFSGPERRFGLVSGHVHLDAIAIHIDRARWTRQFLRQWPEGSDAHASYWHRISAGPDYAPSDALRTQED